MARQCTTDGLDSVYKQQWSAQAGSASRDQPWICGILIFLPAGKTGRDSLVPAVCFLGVLSLSLVIPSFNGKKSHDLKTNHFGVTGCIVQEGIKVGAIGTA